MKLRLLAPFRSHFCLNTGVLATVTDDYVDFWNGVNDRYAGTERPGAAYFRQLRFMHSADNLDDSISYSSIEEDTAPRSLHLIEACPERQKIEGIVGQALARTRATLEGNPEFEPVARALIDSCHLVGDSISFKVFENTLSIVQLDFSLADLSERIEEVGHPVYLSALQEFGVEFVNYFTSIFYEKALFPLLEDLSGGFDSEERYIRPIGRYASFLDISYAAGRPRLFGLLNRNSFFKEGASKETQVLWVTRTLMFEDGDGDWVEPFVEYWLKDIGDEEEVSAVKADPEAFSLSWVNYVAREDADARQPSSGAAGRLTFGEAWDGMVICQYYYSALDALNSNLHYIIAHSYSKKAEKEIRALNNHLKTIVSDTNLLIVDYHEMQKYLNRDKLARVQRIMGIWDFENLIQYAENKMSLCSDRLDDLHRVSTERSSFYTDILLFGIGAISIVDLFITLSEYGRSLATDATFRFRDENPIDFLNLFAQISTDTILSIGFTIITLMLVVYLVIRRRHIL